MSTRIVPEHFKKWENEVLEAKTLLTSSAPVARRTLLDRYTEKKRTSQVAEGHKIADRIRALLDTFKRSEHQKVMHDHFLKCIAKQIYKDAIYEHELEILEYNKWTDLDSAVVISAPRRFGKSYGVGMFCACVLQCMPNAEISIFSTGSRASGASGIGGIVQKFILDHFALDPSLIAKQNDEHFWVRYSQSDLRKLNFYPGSVHR